MSYNRYPDRLATTYGSSYRHHGSTAGNSKNGFGSSSPTLTYLAGSGSRTNPAGALLDSSYSRGMGLSNGGSLSNSPSYKSALSKSTYLPTASHRYTGPYSSGSGTSSLTYPDYHEIFTQIARINSHLFLSSIQAISVDRLRSLGITLLVSATVEPPPVRFSREIDTMHVPVEDMEHANLKSYFDRVADRIQQEKRRGGKALVHCMAGVSRSASLILAYLMKHEDMSLRDAYNTVRSKRPYIMPNMGFWRQLIDYEDRLGIGKSVRMVSTARGQLPDVVAGQLDPPGAPVIGHSAWARRTAAPMYRSGFL